MKISKILYSLLLIMCVFLLSAVSFSEETDFFNLNTFLHGQIVVPVNFIISSPAYRSLDEYSNERINSLNAILKHLSVSVNLDGNTSETAVIIDGETAYSVNETVNDQMTSSVYSFDPDKVYYHSEMMQDQDPVFIRFLEEQFFVINKELDDLYSMFEKIPTVFSEFARSQQENLNYKEFGKAVKRVTVPIPAAYVNDHFPQALAELAETEESRNFINRLSFSGTQKIILLFNEENRVLRINYDGILGFSENSLRKVSLIWRCVRTGNTTKDKLTLKTPAIKGYDKYNITYTRTLDQSAGDKQSVLWDFQLDLKDGDKKSKTQYNAEMISENNEFTGEIVFSEKQNNTETRIAIVPALKKDESGNFTGTLEIAQKKDKILIGSISSQLTVCPGSHLTSLNVTASTGTDLITEHNKPASSLPQEKISEILIRKMMTLPFSDLDFLLLDIPEDIWTSIIQSTHWGK